MKLTLGVVADHASVDASQKLTIVGVFDRIAATAFPVMHPSMALALRFAGESNESNQRRPFRVRLMDEDGRVIIEGTGQVNWPEIAAGDFGTSSLVMQIGGLQLPRAGRFHFEVSGAGLEDSPVQVPFMTVVLPAA